MLPLLPRIWSHKRQRTALPIEHLVLQGAPVLAGLGDGDQADAWTDFAKETGVASDPRYDAFCVKLAGNGMHRPLLGTWMTYVLGCLTPRADKCFKMRSVSFLSGQEEDSQQQDAV